MNPNTLEHIEPYLIGAANELESVRERQLCRGCGSEDIYKECISSWDIETQQWETNVPFYDDKVICNQCGMNASPDRHHRMVCA